MVKENSTENLNIMKNGLSENDLFQTANKTEVF